MQFKSFFVKIKRSVLWVVVSVIAVVALVAGAMALGHHSAYSQNNVSGQATNTYGSASSSPSGQLFSSSPYSQVAYQIFPGSLSSIAQEVMAGISLKSKQNPDGTTTVTLSPTNPSFPGLAYNVSSGDKVYLVETNMGEDNPSANYDGVYADDGAIVVNSAGYIVHGPTVI